MFLLIDFHSLKKVLTEFLGSYKDIESNVVSGSSRSYSPSVRVSPGRYSFNVYTEFNGNVNKIGSKFLKLKELEQVF